MGLLATATVQCVCPECSPRSRTSMEFLLLNPSPTTRRAPHIFHPLLRLAVANIQFPGDISAGISGKRTTRKIAPADTRANKCTLAVIPPAL